MEGSNGGNAPDPNAQDPPEGGSSGDPGGQQNPPEGGGSGSEGTLSAEDARKLRSEARNLRTRLKDAEKERDELKSSQMSEQEKLQNENKTLSSTQQQLISENRNLRAQVVAGRVGIVDPEIVVGLVDWEDADDDKALEKQFTQILKQRPYLAGNVAGGADGAARGPEGSGGGPEDMNTLLRRRAGVIQ